MKWKWLWKDERDAVFMSYAMRIVKHNMFVDQK